MFDFVKVALSSDAAAAGGANPLIMVAIFGGFLILWYVIAIRPQRKKEKELREKIDKMRVGDEVTIMTSAANTLVTYKKSAINSIISRDAKPEPKKEEASENKNGKLTLKKKESSENTEAAEESEKTEE